MTRLPPEVIRTPNLTNFDCASTKRALTENYVAGFAQRTWTKVLRRYQRRTEPDRYSDADPFKIVTVSPDSIEIQQSDRFPKWENVSLVCDGSWDRDVEPVDNRMHRAFRAHFERGIPWSETAFVRSVYRAVQNGQTAWRCSTTAEVHRRCNTMDLLYESIKQKGYQPKSELCSPFRNSWRCWYDEVTVNIGRNGKLIRNNSGKHRLTIAKVQGVPQIPVRILVRHTNWQRIRDEVRTAESLHRLPRRYRQFLDHPDLREFT